MGIEQFSDNDPVTWAGPRRMPRGTSSTYSGT